MASKQVARRTPPAPPAPRVIQGRVVSSRTQQRRSGRKQIPLRNARQRAPRQPPVQPPPADPYVQQAPRRAPRIADRTPRNTITVQTLPGGAYSASRLLTAELIFGVLIVAMRAVADYEPQADGTLRGKVGHPKGQYGPLPILAGLIVTFFLLSFLAASGGTKAKLAVIFGGTIDIALLLKSTDELKTVGNVFGTFGKAKVPPGSWQTSGTEAGALIQGGISSTPTPTPKGTGPPTGKLPTGAIPLPADGNCPAGFFRATNATGSKVWCQPSAIS